jgi:hypothetical protein
LNAQGIVLAKALAHGLRAVALCLAVLPVMAIPILMGGVSWQEVFLSVLFNFSAFCWALAAGLLASARCKLWAWAVTGAMGFVVLFLLIFSSIIFVRILALVSVYMPGTKTALPVSSFVDGALSFAADVGVWRSLLPGPKPWQAEFLSTASVGALLSVLILFLAVGLAGRSVRRRWQERPPSATQEKLERVFCTPRFWVKWFRGWMQWKLERNPVGWLEQRAWSSRLVGWSWLAVLISLNSLALTDFSMYSNHFERMQSALAAMLAGNLAVSAAGSLRRERESGLLELLLVTPLTPGQIMLGRVRALWGQFLPASVLLVGVWFYFRKGFPRDGNEGAILLYLSAFAALPIIGLYFSLKCTHFMGALIWTIGVGVVVPIVMAGLSGQLGPYIIMTGFLAAIAAYMAWLGSYAVRKEKNLTRILAAVFSWGVALYALWHIPRLFHSVFDSWGVAVSTGLSAPGFSLSLLMVPPQLLLAVVLGFKLHRDLARRSFSFQAGRG